MSQTKDYHVIRYGNMHGEIKFGHIWPDNNQSAALLRSGKNEKHYITLEQKGENHRKDGTICRSPGAFQVKAGDNCTTKDEPAVFIDAVSGNLVLNALNGNVEIRGRNVLIQTTGPDNKGGSIRMYANEKIIGKAQTIDFNSKISTKIFSEKSVEVIGKSVLNIYGGMIDCADGATEVNGSKGTPSSNEQKNRAIV
jgi:hypothetical protein